MSVKGESNGRERLAYGFQTPGMLKIIADVHQQVDEHRERNGQPKWDWTGLKSLLSLRRKRFHIPTWIAKFSVSNANQSRQKKPKMEPHTKNLAG